MNRKNIFLHVCLFLFATGFSFSQSYNFAVHGGGTNKEEFGDFKIDDAGNSYVIYKYDGNVTIGDISYSNSNKNSVVAKYAEDGSLVMTKDIVAEGTNFLFCALGVSGDGDVVVASLTKSGVLDGVGVYGGTFIGKIGVDQNFEWVLQPVDMVDRVRQFLEFRVTAIEVFDDAIYVGATADGKISIGGKTDPAYSIANDQSALLIKLNMDGETQWIQQIPTPGVDNHPSIGGGMDYILPSNDGMHLYVAGKVGDGSYNPYEVAYVAKFKKDGTFIWVRKTSSSGADSWGVVETSTGDLITGFGVGGAQTIDFGNGPSLEPSDKGWFGAVAMLDKDGNVKTISYVSDAFYEDASTIGGSNMIRLYNVLISPDDKLIFLGNIVGTNNFKNDLATTSQAGIANIPAQDVLIMETDLNFNPLSVIAHTGGNNEWGNKGAMMEDKLFFSGNYESYTHPFYGTFQAEFGDNVFMAMGDQDVYIASLNLGTNVGFDETMVANNLEVFPNPTSDYLWINTGSNVVLMLQIFSVTGELVDEVYTDESGSVFLDVRNYPKSTYFIKSSIAVVKFVKQ